MTEPTIDALRSRLYRSYVDDFYGWQNDLSPEGFSKQVRTQARSLLPLLPDDLESSILELGCGPGALLEAARARGYSRLSAVDASPQQVELCAKAGFTVTCTGAAEYLRASSERFDAIVMSDVLEHMTKEYAFEVLELCHNHLVPEGRVVIRVPNMSNPLNLRTRYVDLTHALGFTVESLRQMLHATGFNARTIRGDFAVDPRWWIRLVFDHILWVCFRALVKRTLHLSAEIERGKNLLAVAFRR